MGDFKRETKRTARTDHQCCECRGSINPGDVYNIASGTWDGRFYEYKTCADCESARDWLLGTDWPNDIDGEGNSYYFTMLRDHLMDQASEGGKQYKIRAYRHVVMMDRRKSGYVKG